MIHTFRPGVLSKGVFFMENIGREAAISSIFCKRCDKIYKNKGLY